MPNLKYCPFCGAVKAKLLLEHDKDCGRCWVVECQSCYARSSSIIETVSGTQEPDEAFDQIVSATKKAIQAWNGRADADAD